VFQNLPDSVRDLQQCIALLKNVEPLPFDWDVSIYVDVVHHEPQPRCASLTIPHQESENSDDDDSEHEDILACPLWAITPCIIATEAPPFWAVVRSYP